MKPNTFQKDKNPGKENFSILLSNLFKSRPKTYNRKFNLLAERKEKVYMKKKKKMEKKGTK